MLFLRSKTFILDLDTLADPKIVQFLGLGIVTGQLLVPEPPEPKGENDYVAQRAKENLNQLKNIKGLKVKTRRDLNSIADLLQTARQKKATIITCRPDVKSAADGITVVTTLDLFNIFRPSYLPGTVLKVKITKRGKEKNEGIGYLEGGIKVVVENCGDEVGKELEVVIKGGIDTDVGQVLFAQPRFLEVK